MSTMPAYKIELIAAVKDHAEAHYTEGGWDVIVECWTDEMLADAIGRTWTLKGALAKLSTAVSIYADRQADARNSAF